MIYILDRSLQNETISLDTYLKVSRSSGGFRIVYCAHICTLTTTSLFVWSESSMCEGMPVFNSKSELSSRRSLRSSKE